MPKKILVLTPRFPYPLIGGDKIRIYSICKGLAEAGNELTLLSFVTSRRESDFAYLPQIREVFSNVKTVILPKWKAYVNSFLGIFSFKPLQTSYYYSGKMFSLVDKELSSGNYDAIFVHLIRMAPYAVGRDDIYKILEMTDALSLNYSRSKEKGSSGFLGKIYRIEENRVRKYEQECLKKFDISVVVSKIDCDYLMSRGGAKEINKIMVMPHGVLDFMLEAKSEKYDPNLMIFIGNLRTHQNNDAILYFIEEIYPFIKNDNASARLKIIGANPSRRLRKFHGKNGIEITGRVDNVADYAKEACLSISPIRIGAGMRGKILESMAMGIPVVTSSVGFEGIEIKDGKEYFLTADGQKEFADSVLKIMNDSLLREKLSENGKELARRYRYSVIARQHAEKIFNGN